MNKKKLLSIVTLGAATLLFATACSNNTSNTNTKKENKTEQSTKKNNTKSYVKESTFYLGKDGKAIQESDVPKNATIINWYIDPYCPACVKLETLTKDSVEKYLNEKNVVIKYHVLSFLSAKTVDDYSNRAAGWILGVTNVRPDLSYKYLTNIMNQDFHPNGKAKADSEFKKLFIKIGGKESEWKTIEVQQKDLIAQTKKATSKAFNDESLEKLSPTGKMFTPFVVVGNSDKALNFDGTTDAVEYFETQVNNVLKDSK